MPPFDKKFSVNVTGHPTLPMAKNYEGQRAESGESFKSQVWNLINKDLGGESWGRKKILSHLPCVFIFHSILE